MVIGPNVIREMRPEEAEEVDGLLRAAFGGPEEADLVRALRRDGAMAGEFVVTWEERVGAHAAVSRLVAPAGWGCLAPVAVRPQWQRGALWDGRIDPGGRKPWRMGTRLVESIVRIALAPGRAPDFPDTLVVLGEPGFYERCGFSRARAARLLSPYPPTHMMIARAGVDVPVATLVYPAAFAGV